VGLRGRGVSRLLPVTLRYHRRTYPAGPGAEESLSVTCKAGRGAIAFYELGRWGTTAPGTVFHRPHLLNVLEHSAGLEKADPRIRSLSRHPIRHGRAVAVLERMQGTDPEPQRCGDALEGGRGLV